jgi:Protein of unknown function (DUF4242)
MPLYMDIHRAVKGLTAAGAAEGHQKDLEVQGKYGVEGMVFCLCRAPNKEAAEAVHREAHGGVADEITEVKEGT